MDNLLKYIHSLTDFTHESWDLLQHALSKVEYNKNDFLLREGEVSNSIFYIEKGYCRSFYIIDGVEKNINFFFENEITAYLTMNSLEKSKYNIIACEPLSVIQFNKPKLIEIAKNNIEIERMGRLFIHNFAAKQDEFSNLIKLYSAEERLNYIEKYHGEMINRIPLSQLASFLGVARETLSRIRNQRPRN